MKKHKFFIDCPMCGNEQEVINRKAKRCKFCGCSFVKQGNQIKLLDTKGIDDFYLNT